MSYFEVRFSYSKKNYKNFEPFKSFLSFNHVEIKDRILKQAEELYRQFGIRSVSMDDISNALGISKKTIYQHFADKDQLVKEVIQFFMECEHGRAEDVFQKAINPIEEIILSTQSMREMLRNINPALLYDLQKYFPEAWQIYLNQKDAFKEIVQRNLVKGMEVGLYRYDLIPEIMSKFRLESIDMAFNSHVFPAKDFNLLDVQLAFIDHFIRGIVTENGLKIYLELVNKHTNTNLPT